MHVALERSRVLLVAATLLAATVLHAQRAVTGVVRDELGQPIAGAEVVVGRGSQRVVTDSEGRFLLSALPPGVGYITTRAPGTLPDIDLVRISGNDSLDIRLDRISSDADSASVLARAEKSLARITALYASASSSARTGIAFTDRDIAHRSTAYTSDLFREIVGFRIVGDGANASVYTAAGRCAPTIVVDGRERLNMRINEIPVSSIKLLVAYNTYAIVPVELRILRLDQACGLVSVTSR